MKEEEKEFFDSIDKDIHRERSEDQLELMREVSLRLQKDLIRFFVSYQVRMQKKDLQLQDAAIILGSAVASSLFCLLSPENLKKASPDEGSMLAILGYICSKTFNEKVELLTGDPGNMTFMEGSLVEH